MLGKVSQCGVTTPEHETVSLYPYTLTALLFFDLDAICEHFCPVGTSEQLLVFWRSPG